MRMLRKLRRKDCWPALGDDLGQLGRILQEEPDNTIKLVPLPESDTGTNYVKIFDELPVAYLW